METDTTRSWEGLGIAPKLLQLITDSGFKSPSPIQHQAIPVANEGKDVIGIAQTGTGKTFAFGIPTLQSIARNKGQALILAPTRELALQIEEELLRFGRPINLRTAVLIGGASMRPQIDAIRRNPHIIIATPGRLIDHMQQRIVSLKGITILILDEADRMLDMGFMPQIKKVLEVVPAERQTMLFSATLSPEIMTIAAKHMKLPVRIEVAPAGTTAEKIEQEIIMVSGRDAKLPLLESVLKDHKGTALVFTRTKHGAKKVAMAVKRMGWNSAELHSNRSLGQRKDALEGFKKGKYRVLVATDIAARGIDVKNIELVINFDLPMHSEDYVHRIGRTARAGAEGKAISFAMTDERHGIRAIERLIKKPIKVSHSNMPKMTDAQRKEYGTDDRSQSDRPARTGYGNRGPSRFSGGSRGASQGRSNFSGGSRNFSRGGNFSGNSGGYRGGNGGGQRYSRNGARDQAPFSTRQQSSGPLKPGHGFYGGNGSVPRPTRTDYIAPYRVEKKPADLPDDHGRE